MEKQPVFFLMKASGNSTSVVCKIFINSVLKQHYHYGSQTVKDWLKCAHLYFSSFFFPSKYLHMLVFLKLYFYRALCITNMPLYTHVNTLQPPQNPFYAHKVQIIN